MTAMTDLMSQFASYDEARQYYDNMVRDRRRCGELYNEIKNLRDDLNSGKVPAQQKNDVIEEIGVYARVRDRIEGNFSQDYGVDNIKELSNKIRAFGPELEGWFGQEVQSQSQQGQSQGGQQSTESALAQRTMNMMEYSKFAEMHIQHAQAALDSRNYELFQVESNKAFYCMQEVSRQVEYSQQLLRQEMERGGQTHHGNQHGNILHTELKAHFDAGEVANLSRKERLERLDRFYREQRQRDLSHDYDRDR